MRGTISRLWAFLPFQEGAPTCSFIEFEEIIIDGKSHFIPCYFTVRCVDIMHKRDMKVTEKQLERKFISIVLVASNHEFT